MALATLSVDLEARLAKFEQGMDRAGRLLEKLSASANTAGGSIGKVFAGNLLADAAGQALQRLVTYFPQVADGVLAIKDLAEATGSSVENISALDDIARRSGDSLQAVEGVIIKFNAALKEADGKNSISQALQALGLNAKELREIDPAEALLKTAQALNGFADDGNRARLTQELFGKGVKDAATFLRDLAEAGKLSAKVTTEQAEEVDRYNKLLANFRTNIDEAARSVLFNFLPAMNRLFERFNNKGLAGVLGQNEVDELASRAKALNNVSTSLVMQLERWQPMAERGVGGASEKVAELRTQLANVLRESAAVSVSLKGIAGPANTPDNYSNEGRNKPKPSLPFTGNATKLKEAKSSFEDYQQTLTRGLANLIERTDTVKLAELNAQLDKLAELSAAGLDPKIVEQVQRLLVPPSGPNSGPQISDEMRRLNDLLLQTDSAKLAAAAKDAAILRDELSKTAAGSAKFIQLQEALLDVETSIDDLAKTFPNLTEKVDESAIAMQQTIEGALGASFRSALEGNFNDIGKMWGNLLIDMAARAATAQLMDKLFGAVGAGGKRSGGGWIDLALAAFSGATKSANGNAFGQGGLYAFANGGVVSGATPFTFGGGKLGVMGESGDEGVFPLKRGRDGKLGVAATGGSRPVVVHNNITVSGDPNPSTLAAMQAMLARSNAQLVRGFKTGTVGAG
ncbi:MAG: hypothetical protein RJA36_3937 [Pseudomonadota bacterium]|jgi:hypothetical protein